MHVWLTTPQSKQWIITNDELRMHEEKLHTACAYAKHNDYYYSLGYHPFTPQHLNLPPAHREHALQNLVRVLAKRWWRQSNPRRRS